MALKHIQTFTHNIDRQTSHDLHDQYPGSEVADLLRKTVKSH
jgi:hypothetical protein